MKALKVSVIVLLAIFSYQVASAQAKRHHVRHHGIKRHHHRIVRHH